MTHGSAKIQVLACMACAASIGGCLCHGGQQAGNRITVARGQSLQTGGGTSKLLYGVRDRNRKLETTTTNGAVCSQPFTYIQGMSAATHTYEQQNLRHALLRRSRVSVLPFTINLIHIASCTST